MNDRGDDYDYRHGCFMCGVIFGLFIVLVVYCSAAWWILSEPNEPYTSPDETPTAYHPPRHPHAR